ncbi:MAG TPA: hypothetical protein VMD79_00035, partial [Solirubrobacteraceae bacterium]|nr:hypothetical protein [Solirubrobacteraceae bacterium]
APVDVEPERKRKRTHRGSLIAPEEPGEQLSRGEFQELVRDLDVETGGQPQPRAAAPTSIAERDPTADLAPEDLVLKEPSKPAREKRKRSRNKRHGRSR